MAKISWIDDSARFCVAALAAVSLGWAAPAAAQGGLFYNSYSNPNTSLPPANMATDGSRLSMVSFPSSNFVAVLRIAETETSYTYYVASITLPDGANAREVIWYDGEFWVLEPGIGKIAEIGRDPDTNVWSVINQIPVPGLDNNSPGTMTLDSQGNLHVALSGAIGQITSSTARISSAIAATTPTVNSFVIPTPAGAARPPNALNFAASTDGNVWFTQTPPFDAQGIPIFTGQENIGRITPAGVITQFPIPTRFAGTGDKNTTVGNYITAGPDGNIWFTEESARKIGRVTPGGVITEFPLPAGASTLLGIVAGPDGNLWIRDYVGKIHRMTTAGAVTTYTIPTANTGSDRELVLGPDGALWFPEDSKIGRITTAGTITEYSLPTPTVNGSPIYPFELQFLPDGTGMLIEYTTNKIGIFAVPPMITGNASGPLTARVLNVTVQAFPADVGGTRQVFVAAILETQIFFRTPAGWQAWTGGSFPAYFSGALPAQMSIPVLDGSINLSGAVGAQIYAGYGTDGPEMLANGRYALAHTVQ